MTRSNPYAELAQQTDKYANMATELHMGRKGITELWDFENFTNLHTLWLNNNQLQSLEGLEANVRLLNLHCHGNRISRISDTLQHLKFLVSLTLNQNSLTDIEEVISELRHLRNLQYLDLFDNPITQEDNYRLRMIGELPWVQVLDKHKVTDDERKQAKKVLKKFMKSKNILNKKSKAETFDSTGGDAKEEPPDVAPYVLDKLKRIVTMHRVFLEKSLMDFDPQKRGIVESEIFSKVCNQYGLFQELSEEDVTVILNRYASRHQDSTRRTDKRSLVHSASSGALYKTYIQYPEFCKLIQPDRLRTMRFDKWKMEPVAELSRGAADLDRFVKTIVKKREDQAELDKKRSLMSSQTNTFNMSIGATGTAGSAMGTSGTRSSTAPGITTTLGDTALVNLKGTPEGPQGIDSWLSATIRSFVKSLVKEGGISVSSNASTVSSIPGNDAISKILSEMQLHGKIPSVNAKVVRSNIDSLCDQEGKIGINVLCEVIGCAPIVHVKKNPESVPTRKPSNAKPVPKIKWVDMSPEEQQRVEREKFSESASYMDALLRTGKGADTKELFEGTIKAATVGTRLMSTRELNPKSPPVYTPAQLIAAAPDKRADIVILPRLNKNKTSSAPEPPVENEASDFEATWRRQFMSLGLKKHELEFAIDRKKRSQGSKGVGVSSLSRSAANAFYGLRPVSQGEFTTSKHKSNWNTSTGTFLLQKTG